MSQVDVGYVIEQARSGRPIDDLIDVREILAALGYVRDWDLDADGDALPASLARFQRDRGIEQTGRLDFDTISRLLAPTCSLDSPLAVRSHRPLCSWGHDHLLSYKFGTLVDRPPQEVVRAAIRRAFATWDAEPRSPNFREAGDGEVADVIVEWIDQDIDYNHPGWGLTLSAHSDYPGECAETLSIDPEIPLHFAYGFAWIDGQPNPDPASREIDIETAAVHEIGHIVGLRHLENPSAVMFADVTGQKRQLHPDDIAFVRHLYPQVPDVVHATRSQAKSRVFEAGLVPTFVGGDPLGGPSYVDSQSPGSGTDVEFESVVTLRMAPGAPP